MLIEWDVPGGGSAWGWTHMKREVHDAMIEHEIARVTREVERQQAVVDAKSDRLGSVSFTATTVRRRAMMRIDLDRSCAMLTGLKNQLDALKEAESCRAK